MTENRPPLPYYTTDELVDELRSRLPLFFLSYGKDEEGDLQFLHYTDELWIDEVAGVDPTHLLSRSHRFIREYMEECGLNEDYDVDE